VYAQVTYQTLALCGLVGVGKQDWSLVHVPCTLSSLRRCLLMLGDSAIFQQAGEAGKPDENASSNLPILSS